jgi:hypothetical protein
VAGIFGTRPALGLNRQLLTLDVKPPENEGFPCVVVLAVLPAKRSLREPRAEFSSPDALK